MSFRPGDGEAFRMVNQSGDVDVAAYHGMEVRVDATVLGPTDASVDAVAVNGESRGGEFVVETVYEGEKRRASVDLAVRVPADVPVAGVRTRNGDVAARDVAGGQHFESENGDVTVRGVESVSVARTRNGDVRADVPAPLSGDATVESENGDVTAALSPDLSAMVDARTTNGRVDVEDLDLGDASVSGKHVTGRLGDGAHEVSVATTNGDVVLESL